MLAHPVLRHPCDPVLLGLTSMPGAGAPPHASPAEGDLSGHRGLLPSSSARSSCHSDMSPAPSFLRRAGLTVRTSVGGSAGFRSASGRTDRPRRRRTCCRGSSTSST